MYRWMMLCLCSAESHGLAAEAYTDALEGCKKSAKKVEDKFVAKMQELNVSIYKYCLIFGSMCIPIFLTTHVG